MSELKDLLQSKNKNSSLLNVIEISPSCLAIKDSELNYVYCNEAYKKLFGIKKGVVNDFDFLDPISAFELSKSDLNQLNLEDLGDFEKELTLKKSKIKVQARFSYSILEEENEKFLLISAVELQNFGGLSEVDKYKEILDKTNSELDQFVYKTAHDLRAPITNLIGLIGLMRNESNPKVLASYFDLQETSLNKLDNFIQTITTYTKNTRLPIKISKINFNQLIDSVLNDFLYVQNSDKLVKIVKIDAIPDYYSDKLRIEIIIKNLLSNSLQFIDTSKKKSIVKISIGVTNKFIVISIQDNGLGIDKEVIPKVFDMFYRGNNVSKGSGLGLYIVNDTINKLNGRIELMSEKGEYTEFKLYLPNLLPN
mgnify:CR=1 FL=1